MTPGRGRLRVWRGATLAAACLAFPATAHAAAGGGVPAHGTFLFAAALLSTACVALADQQRAPGEIAAVIALTQPALHIVLALAGHQAAAIVPTPGMLAAHGVATLMLTALLAGGEALVWSIAALASTILGLAARRLLRWSAEPPCHAPTRTAVGERPRLIQLIATVDAPRRGPPAIAGV